MPLLRLRALFPVLFTAQQPVGRDGIVKPSKQQRNRCHEYIVEIVCDRDVVLLEHLPECQDDEQQPCNGQRDACENAQNQYHSQQKLDIGERIGIRKHQNLGQESAFKILQDIPRESRGAGPRELANGREKDKTRGPVSAKIRHALGDSPLLTCASFAIVLSLVYAFAFTSN